MMAGSAGSKKRKGGENSCVSRADLLCILEDLDDEGLVQAARHAGYEFRQKKKRQPVPTAVPTVSIKSSPGNVERPLIKSVPVKFFRVAEHRANSDVEIQADEPPWLKKATVFEGAVQADYSIKPPDLQPLVPWARLWPFLREALGATRDSKQADMDRAVDIAAAGKPVCRLPFKQRKGWAPLCQLILDLSPRLQPFSGDIFKLWNDTDRLRGSSGFEIVKFENGPDGKCGNLRKSNSQEAFYQIPEPETAVLIVSDLGCFGHDDSIRKSWVRFGRKLKKTGLNPVVLTPVPPRLWDESLSRLFRLACWDRGTRLPKLDHPIGRGASPRSGPIKNPDKSIEKLLSLLSPAIRVEPALLRAMRQLLPEDEADTGIEAAVWLHENTRTNPVAFSFDPRVIEKYRNAFKNDEPEEIQKKAIALINKHHRHLSPAVINEEKYIGWNLTGFEPDESETFMPSFVKTIENPGCADREEMKAWFRRLAKRQHSGMWQSDVFSAAWVKVFKEELDKGDVTVPPGFDLRNVFWALNPLSKPIRYTLRQKGLHFVMDEQPWGMGKKEDGWEDRGSPVAEFVSGRGAIQIVEKHPKREISRAITLSSERIPQIQVPQDYNILIKTDYEEILIDSCLKPSWAKGIGRDKYGLFVMISENNMVRKAYWFNPGRYELGESLLNVDKGFWWDESEYREFLEKGFAKPEWADSAGMDRYGLYADFSIEGVTQRMRWIKPGEFFMGSPEGELERSKDEIRHEVILTRGFWLADTACTQALWEAVTGKNPSAFKGTKRPVENVSWNDCMEFIEKINSQKQDLNLRLPGEAEWEYACRAGTDTPFFFGENITTDQANYDGGVPYANGKKGKKRGKTVEVKSLPCNDWGLYEMHGNVYEWCRDWYDEYPNDTVTDPEGPESGDGRVLRGGCWFSFGRDVRSAVRDRFEPGYRYDDMGFRLARGQKGPAEPKAGKKSAGGTERSGVRQIWKKMAEGIFRK